MIVKGRRSWCLSRAEDRSSRVALLGARSSPRAVERFPGALPGPQSVLALSQGSGDMLARLPDKEVVVFLSLRISYRLKAGFT